ncbi:MAG TPA: response regulator transcription factor [Terriglobales bacterium]|nr:response regulator transcription factor [Terriglobales bacterium]
MIRVLLAEDERMVREALAVLLSLEPDIAVVAQVGRGDEVVEAALRTAPDVMVLDIEIPGRDGISVAEEVGARLPACRVLMLTTFERPGYLRRALSAGADGFVLKSTPAHQFPSVVRRTAAGERVVDPVLAAASEADGDSPLSKAEQDVLAAAAGGADVSTIAGRLGLARSTVRNRLSSAIQKVAAHNRAQAARIAREKGWL